MLKIVRTLDDTIELRDWLYRQPSVAVDTETTGVDIHAPNYRVRLLQFGNATEAWVLPTEGWEGLAAQLFRTYPGRLIFHNSSFDVRSLQRVGVEVPWAQVDDTMIAMRLAEPHLPSGLKPCAVRHVSRAAGDSQKDLHEAMRKHRWDWATVPLDFWPYVYYAAMDTIITYRLAHSPVCVSGFGSPLYRLEMDVRKITSEMESAGMRVDVDFCRTTVASLEEELDSLKAEAFRTYGVVLTSPSQLARGIMDLGGKIRKRTSTGAPSVDKESLGDIITDNTTTESVDLARKAMRARDLLKLSGNYFTNFIELQQDGLLHPSIETIAARTGRSSIRNPALQTLPRGDNPDAKLVRRAVVPRNEGEVLLSCDYEQIELRLIAAASRDEGLIEAFGRADTGEGADFFTEAMRATYGDAALPKSDPRRTLIKTLMYASAYGAGVSKMAVTAGVPEDEMRDVSSRVFSRYPGIKRLMRECEREARDGDSWITTPMGRRIYVDPDATYKALNAKIQGFAADVFKATMVELGQLGLAQYMVVPVHDEILFSVPEELVGDVTPIIRDTMSKSWQGVQLPADPSPGAMDWGSVDK